MVETAHCELLVGRVVVPTALAAGARFGPAAIASPGIFGELRLGLISPDRLSFLKQSTSVQPCFGIGEVGSNTAGASGSSEWVEQLVANQMQVFDSIVGGGDVREAEGITSDPTSGWTLSEDLSPDERAQLLEMVAVVGGSGADIQQGRASDRAPSFVVLEPPQAPAQPEPGLGG